MFDASYPRLKVSLDILNRTPPTVFHSCSDLSCFSTSMLQIFIFIGPDM